MTTSTITIRLDTEVKEGLELIAQGTNRSRNFVASDAIAEYVKLNAWQIEAIEEGVQAADAGEFASEEDMERIFSKYPSS